MAGAGGAGTWVTFVIMTESAAEQTAMLVMISILTPCLPEELGVKLLFPSPLSLFLSACVSVSLTHAVCKLRTHPLLVFFKAGNDLFSQVNHKQWDTSFSQTSLHNFMLLD